MYNNLFFPMARPTSLEALLKQHFIPRQHSTPRWTEDENTYTITLLAAGLSHEDISLEQVDNTLVLEFSHKDDSVTSASRFTWTLPTDANTAQLKASLDQGLLKLVLPKKEKESIKFKIEVDSVATNKTVDAEMSKTISINADVSNQE